MGEYGPVEQAAQERVMRSHLAPTLKMFELVDENRDGQLGVREIEAAEQELKKRHEQLNSQVCRQIRLIFRPNQSSAYLAGNSDPSTWTARLVGNWTDWLEAHEATWNPAEGVFDFFVSIPVGQAEFKFVINDEWGEW